jgi:hypothetical protein
MYSWKSHSGSFVIRITGGTHSNVSRRSLCLLARHALSSLLPQHKITNGIGLSAEEHVEWMLKDDGNNREGRVNSINAALGPDVKQFVGSYMR